MQPTHVARGLNLRLVLGVAGALIGCGAVAAATRPAWHSAIFGPAQRVRTMTTAAPRVASAAPVQVAATRPPPVAPTYSEPASAPEPAPAAAEQGVTIAAAAQPQQAEPLTVDDEVERYRSLDPRAFYQKGLAAYMERCAAGDAQGCMDVARSIRGERTASKWWAKTPNAAARMSEELARAYEVELSRAQLQKVALLSLDRADALAIDVKLDLAKMAAEREEAARAWIVADDGQDMVVGGTIELQGATGDGRVILNYTPAPR